MPKGSEELTNARKEEIVSACASLYANRSFRDITIREIGEKTSFTRTSIYNYFQTKEEIFLALLQQEHELWIGDLEQILQKDGPLSAEELAGEMAAALERRGCMLKLMSMNIYDMEINSRLENLAAFKRVYRKALEQVALCLEKFVPRMGRTDREDFVFTFFPFLFGVYPYTNHTEKQLEAMKLAQVETPECTVSGMIQSFVLKLLKPFEEERNTADRAQ